MNIQAKRSALADWQEISPDQLAAFCLNVTGGGYTVQQTAKAMELQRSILAGELYKGKTGIEIRTTQ